MLPSEQPESPRRTANFLSCLLFTWVIPLFKKGYSKTLGLEDMYRVLPEDETSLLAKRMEAAWCEQVEKNQEKLANRSPTAVGKMPKPSLIKACVKVFGPRLALFGLCAIFEECIVKLAQPILLGYLLDYFRSPQDFKPYQGYLFAGGVALCTISYTTSDHPYTFGVQHLGMQMRISLCAIIYRKALRVSKYALEQTSAGQIVNYLSTDMNRFDVFFTFFHYIWVAPIQFVLVTGLLYWYVDLDWPIFPGMVLLVIFVPFQGVMGKLFSKLRSQTATKTDTRLLVLEEILSAMRVIKMYGWEKPFADMVNVTRRAEIRCIRKSALYKALNHSIFAVTSRTTLFMTFMTYALTGHSITAKKVYITLTLYQSVQYVLALFFPFAIMSLAETLVALKRIQTFLILEERSIPALAAANMTNPRIRRFEMNLSGGEKLSKFSMYFTPTGSPSSNTGSTSSMDEIGVFARGISARWSVRSKELAFNNVSFDVRAGESLALIGPTASGKSSILNSILYELPVQNGDFRVVGSVAYSCQEPWVFSGTVRDNILFGKPYNSVWYDEVAYVCALTRDFQQLPYADHTLVGEKGTALSGGQKARVTLARAVYADADVYLLDDPLSAVDAQVGRHIMEKCVLGLLKYKCRILVTHQLQHVKHCDQVLLMDDGNVAHTGDYKSLQKSGIPFSELLNPEGVSRRLTADDRNERISVVSSHFARDSVARDSVSSVALADKSPVIDANPTPDKVGETSLEGQEEEHMEQGSVSCRSYYNYFHSGSGTCVLMMMMCLIFLTQCVFTGTDLWLRFWIDAESNEKNGTREFSPHPLLRRIQKDHRLRLLIYSGLIALLFGMVFLRTQLFYRRCMRSSVQIYDQLFYGVLRSPMKFFEVTPVGRILNRFAKDIGVIDECLPNNLYDCIEISMQCVGVFIIVALNSPYMLIPSALLICIFAILRKFYFRTARAIKRLEGVARSPIFSHLSTSLNGLSTIRSFGVEQKFVQEFDTLSDIHNSTWYLFLACARCLAVVVDWIAVTYIAIIALNFLLGMQLGISYGDAAVGVSLTSVMMLTSMCQWGMRQSAEMENHMIAFERVSEYMNLEPEAALESAPDKKPPEDWPQEGEIKIQNLCLRYRLQSPTLVLKNITCTIYAGEKVGIVGRTGAGKSSLIAVLFRLAEPTSGTIEIDGIQTTTLGLHDLRSKISIIPQEPVIFMGTVRRNLDPFHEYNDDEIWKALQEANLGDTVKDMEGALDGEINEGGANFSAGQKQLLCLARAILKRNKILVLDEATASIDPETDKLIQRTIRRNFSDCTVLTIAHRLHTVMDSDRILVLSAGQIAEFDEPATLLSNRHSMLYQLVQQTGKAEASNLAHIAKIAALRRRPVVEKISDRSKGSQSSITSYSTATTDMLI